MASSTTITCLESRTSVHFSTPYGNVTATLNTARRIAEQSGTQHELDEALQNPGIPVAVANTTRAKGTKTKNYARHGISLY